MILSPVAREAGPGVGGVELAELHLHGQDPRDLAAGGAVIYTPPLYFISDCPNISIQNILEGV